MINVYILHFQWLFNCYQVTISTILGSDGCTVAQLTNDLLHLEKVAHTTSPGVKFIAFKQSSYYPHDNFGHMLLQTPPPLPPHTHTHTHTVDSRVDLLSQTDYKCQIQGCRVIQKTECMMTEQIVKNFKILCI